MTGIYFIAYHFAIKIFDSHLGYNRLVPFLKSVDLLYFEFVFDLHRNSQTGTFGRLCRLGGPPETSAPKGRRLVDFEEMLVSPL